MKRKPAILPALSSQVRDARYCFLEPRIAPGARLRVSCAGREQCSPEYRVAREGFAGYGIEFVAQGGGEVLLDGKSWPLRPGALFCYGPRTAHVITTDRANPMVKYFVDFFGTAALPALRKRLAPGDLRYTFDVEGFRSLFEAILREGGNNRPASRAICVHFLEALILKMEETHSRDAARPSHAAVNFQRCIAFIDRHYLEAGSLEEIAKGAHISAAYLCRLFRRFGAPAPYQYLTRKKLNRAAELLAGQAASVKAVAAAVGYADSLHFSRLFRNHFRQSPSEFAKTHRKY